MNFRSVQLIGLLALSALAPAAVGAPGGPIGGIIVKGGRNPGGQMMVLATTDSEGKFRISLADRGEYRIAFERSARSASGAQNPTDLRLEYVVNASDGKAVATKAKAKLSEVSGATHRSSDLNNIRLLVYVPTEGAELTGSFRAMSGPADLPLANRAINESGVSVKPEKPKVRGKP